MITPSRGSDGFSLVETLIAVALLAGLATSFATLTTLSARALARSRLETTAVHLAHTRLEQLRALTWSHGSAFDPAPAFDASTDLSTAVPTGGGRGLNRSPAGALDADCLGYVDYLDRGGQWLGNGPPGPVAARFVRRWGIEDVSGHQDLLLIRVRVIDRRMEVPSFELATLRVRTTG